MSFLVVLYDLSSSEIYPDKRMVFGGCGLIRGELQIQQDKNCIKYILPLAGIKLTIFSGVWH
jgi:hypothetical protein